MLTEPESQGIKWAVGPVSEAPGAEKSLLFSIRIIDTCSHAWLSLGCWGLDLRSSCLHSKLSLPWVFSLGFVFCFLCLVYLGSPRYNEVALSPTMHRVLIKYLVFVFYKDEGRVVMIYRESFKCLLRIILINPHRILSNCDLQARRCRAQPWLKGSRVKWQIRAQVWLSTDVGREVT